MNCTQNEEFAMDTFAQIAAGGIQGRLDELTIPSPVMLPDNHVTLSPSDVQPTHLPEKMRTAAQLQAALAEKRRWATPFLQNHAPNLESCREVISLREFRYQKADDAHWQTVTVPHYGGPLGAARVVYETCFKLPALNGRRAFIVINGADYKTAVYVNGQMTGTHEGFFATFEFDITDYVTEGENTLTIRLENDYVMLGSRGEDDPTTFFGDKIYAATGPGYDDTALGWHHCPPGMGLLDTVEVQLRAPVFLNDVFARTLDAEMEFWIEAGSSLYQPQNVSFAVSIYGQNLHQVVVEHLEFVPSTGKKLGLGDTFTEVNARREGTLNAMLPQPCYKGRNLYKLRIPAKDLKWWSPEEPWLYQIQVKLKDENGNVLDTICRQFGRRTFTQDLQSDVKGMFYLNGKAIRLRGTNTMGFEQQDVMRGDYDQLIDDILLGKLCNMNFWRITQRPVQKQVYDYCDRLGLMVQTDLPMFGGLRRHQFCEAVRQAEEMERHIRSHPSCILVTYINEPFPNANNMPNINLEREELEKFFDAADIVVRLNNPDRVIKHVDGDYDPPSETLPDNHCYPMWYNGHGIDIGRLHKGYWMPVKPGWYYGCGEFGCEGLENWKLMQDAYPAKWLVHPGEAETDWDPARIVGAQTANFYHFFYDRPETPQEWVEKSQDFQRIATRMMTEAFRRDDRMITFAIHLFIDAFPSGWMKTIMDCRRTPKPAFFAYRDALEPLMISLRADKTHFFGGETAKAEGWLCNDSRIEGEYVMRFELVMDGRVLASAEQKAVLQPNCARCHSVAEFRLPVVQQRTSVWLRGILMDGSKCMAWNELEYVVLPACGELFPMRVRCVDAVTAEDLAAVENGETLWIDKPSEGVYHVGSFDFRVKVSGMAPMHFASPKTGHAWVEGFRQEDFRHWYSAREDCIAPLADCTVTAKGFHPVLISRNLGSDGKWQPESVLCEHTFGKGRIVLSEISYEQMLDNPAGCIILSRISGKGNIR